MRISVLLNEEKEEIEKVNQQEICKEKNEKALEEKMEGTPEKMAHRPCILVSACLLGAMCRYDGKSNGLAGLERLQETATFLPFCPEVYGGLPTPREPSEIKDGKVCSKSGRDVTAQFEKGAQEALRMAKLLGCSAAILKERSPSCGSHQIYDGTFQGKRIEGRGVTAALLEKNGIRLFNEEQAEECFVWLEKHIHYVPKQKLGDIVFDKTKTENK